jgi:acylphosphatase
MKRVIIRVSGRVQGVFYRASAKKEADRLGVHGLVRNESNGSVLLEAEGSEPNLAEFITWCKKGPAGAQVVTFIIEYAEAVGYVDFRIQR